MRHVAPLFLALLIGGTIAALRGFGTPLDLFELRAYDFRLKQRGVQETAPEVVLVAVDDDSLGKLGRWPWSRARVGELLARITAGNPRVIGMDLVQAEPTASCDLAGLSGRVGEACQAEVARATSGPDSDDARLATAIRESGRIVLGYFFDFSRKEDSVYDGESVYQVVLRSPGANDRRVQHGRYLQQNLPGLAEAAAGLAYFNFRPDEDGLYRHAMLAVVFNDRIMLPLSLAMLQRAFPEAKPAIRIGPFGVESVRVGTQDIPVDDRGQMLINYRGPGSTFPPISAAAVLDGRVPPETFRDKLVVVGVTAIGVGDVRAAPLDRVYPGAEIHATVLDNILRADFIHLPSWAGPDVAVILGLALLLGIGLQFTRGLGSLLLAAAMLVGYAVASQLLFTGTGTVLGIAYQTVTILLVYVGVSVQHYLNVDREKRRTRRMLDLYLSPALAEYISERPETLALGGEKRDRTVLFSDVKGFTTISERLAPEQLVELLNTYLGEMTEVVFAHDGMLDKYIGDGVMAVWGAPVPQDDHAARACRAALDMIGRLDKLNAAIAEKGWPQLSVRIGLNSGPMVFGNMGSPGHLSLTVMGDNVNLGARLEGVNKQYGTTILASEATVVAAGDTIITRELDVVRVKGKDETSRIYEVLCAAEQADEWAAIREHFTAGLALYRARDFKGAIVAFERVLDERSNDHPSALYIRRARALVATPPPPEWEAVVNFDEK